MKHVTCNIIFGAFLFVLLASPVFVSAAGLVPCSGEDCTVCHFITLVDKVIKFLLTILILPACVVALIVAGILIMTAVGDPAKLQKGKDIFKYAIMGIIISYGAWLLINNLLGNIINDKFLSGWFNFPTCK
ncbi:hypothetical protein KJ751_01895 [Patescibacteria group bacterium]|nr:hypothetical protein [Patescibacteria group bacterium]